MNAKKAEIRVFDPTDTLNEVFQYDSIREARQWVKDHGLDACWWNRRADRKICPVDEA